MSWGQFEWLRKKLHQSAVDAAGDTAKVVADYSVANQNYIVGQLVSDNDATRDEILNGIPSRVPSGITVTGVVSGVILKGAEVSYDAKGILLYYSGNSDGGDNYLTLDGIPILAKITGLSAGNGMNGPYFFSRSIRIRRDSGGGGRTAITSLCSRNKGSSPGKEAIV